MYSSLNLEDKDASEGVGDVASATTIDLDSILREITMLLAGRNKKPMGKDMNWGHHSTN